MRVSISKLHHSFLTLNSQLYTRYCVLYFHRRQTQKSLRNNTLCLLASCKGNYLVMTIILPHTYLYDTYLLKLYVEFLHLSFLVGTLQSCPSAITLVRRQTEKSLRNNTLCLLPRCRGNYLVVTIVLPHTTQK